MTDKIERVRQYLVNVANYAGKLGAYLVEQAKQIDALYSPDSEDNPEGVDLLKVSQEANRKLSSTSLEDCRLTDREQKIALDIVPFADLRSQQVRDILCKAQLAKAEPIIRADERERVLKELRDLMLSKNTIDSRLKVVIDFVADQLKQVKLKQVTERLRRQNA